MKMLLEAILILGGLSLFFGLLIGLAAKKFAIKKDLRLEKVIATLPGMNCGACGFASCEAAAEAIVKGKAKPDVCIMSKKNPQMVEKIKEILEEK